MREIKVSGTGPSFDLKGFTVGCFILSFNFGVDVCLHNLYCELSYSLSLSKADI